MSNICANLLELWGHLKATFWYGIAPLIIFSVLNYVLACVVARIANVDKPSSRLFGISFGGIGIAVGLLTGLSRAAAIGAVVPALLTFISGFVIYVLGTSSEPKWRSALPIALLCMVFGTICSTVYGSSERNSYDQRTHRYEEWRLNYEKVQLPVSRELLEKKLKLIAKKPDSSS